MRKLFAALCVGALMLAGCSLFGGSTTPLTTQQTVVNAYTASEASVTAAAVGVQKSVQAGLLTPGSTTALAIKAGLDAASKALDAANAYIAAGQYTAAQSQVDSANQQVTTAQTATPTVPADTTTTTPASGS